jgi:glycosyltransferase involved in cell wall biosynthesis
MEAGTFTYLFFGNLRRYKGLELLVQAFSKLEGEHLRLVIAGKVFEKEDEVWLLEAVAKDSRIIFRNGFVPNEDVANLIKSSDVVVLPFVRTLSSGSALLAITYGRPLILPDLAKVFGVPGVGGALYFNDSYSLEQAMRKAEKIDLVPYRNHNYQLANKLTWEAMADIIEKNYTK